jgi:hypothetical protein
MKLSKDKDAKEGGTSNNNRTKKNSATSVGNVDGISELIPVKENISPIELDSEVFIL